MKRIFAALAILAITTPSVTAAAIANPTAYASLLTNLKKGVDLPDDVT